MLKGSRVAIIKRIQPISIHGQVSLDVFWTDPDDPEGEIRHARVGEMRDERTKHSARMAIDQKDQKSNQNKPKLKSACAASSSSTRPSRVSRRSRALGNANVYTGTQAYSLFTMSRLSVIPRIRQGRGGIRSTSFTDAFGWSPVAGVWWSQTGSNRRPQACKASALPTELWPRRSAHCKSGDQGSRPGPSQRMMWWAWEDLNFRPHAYQARALTN